MKKSDRHGTHDYKRLHPAAMLYFVAKILKELYGLLPVIPIIVVSAPTLLGESVNRFWLSVWLIVFVLLLLTLFSWQRWLRFKYRIEHRAIYIEQGIWVKKKTWITRDRIQSIDTTESIYDRVMGLVRLQVETAGGEKPEAVLSSISAAEARRIQESLGFAAAPPLVHPDSVPDRKETDLNIPAAAGTASVHDPSGDQKMIFSFQRLLVHSATSGMIGYVFIILIILLFKYGEDIMKSLKLWESFPDWLDSGWITVSLSLGLLIVVSWLLAVTVTFLRDYGFQLELSNDKLTIERGLLERKHLTIPLDRIQAVHLVRHWLHRPFGWVSIRAVVAGKTEKQEKSILIFPIVRSGEAADVLNRFIPSFTLPEAWRGLQPRAWRYFVFTPVLCCLIAAVPAIIWIPGSLGWLTLLLPAVILLTEQMAYRQMGWSAANGQIAVRYGGFSLHQALIPKRRIQWVQMSQTPFQEQRKLANLKIALAAGRGAAKFTLRCASESDIRQLADWISISRKDSKK